MLVLMKKRIMGEKGMKNGEFHHFWVIFATCTDTGAEQVRYSLQNQTSTGTGSALFFYFNQRPYFGHNLLISNPI